MFHDGGPCHIETSPMIWRANQWTGFYMIETFVMKEFNFVRNIDAVWKVFIFGVILVGIVPHTNWIRRDTVVMLIGYGQEHENVSIFNRFWCSHLIFRACILISHFNVMKILNALLKTYKVCKLEVTCSFISSKSFLCYLLTILFVSWLPEFPKIVTPWTITMIYKWVISLPKLGKRKS